IRSPGARSGMLEYGVPPGFRAITTWGLAPAVGVIATFVLHSGSRSVEQASTVGVWAGVIGQGIAVRAWRGRTCSRSDPGCYRDWAPGQAMSPDKSRSGTPALL